MQIVQRMTQDPQRCLYCGNGNVEEHAPFLDLERDVNWGDYTYLCSICVARIAVLFGYMTEEEAQGFKDKIENMEAEVYELKATLEQRDQRLERILVGARTASHERERTGIKKPRVRRSRSE